jgi:hypothetical protein
MYRFPKTFDLNFLIDKEVENLTFAAYLVIVRFNDDAWLQIEG